ncbi:MAG: hypothetical protein LLF94_00700 [Chlamydiales bacterium]|nr:hypothetical protein [Chlamydiales bacterium]
MYLLLALFITCSRLHALVLEDLVQTNILQDKRVGYYVGSFDPLHKAHEAIAIKALEYCDYVLIHPVWGGDIYKKRSDINIRLDMLFAVFKDHPRVIVSRYTPIELQNTLQNTATFIGILGSDTLTYLLPDPETSIVYMTGLQIPEKYATHTWGSCMALEAQSFIVAIRNGDKLQSLYLRERPIIATFEIGDVGTLSSTGLKKTLQCDHTLRMCVSDPVADIIQKHALYKN